MANHSQGGRTLGAEDDLVNRRGPNRPHQCMVCKKSDRDVIDIDGPGDTEFRFHWIHPKCLQRITLS